MTGSIYVHSLQKMLTMNPEGAKRAMLKWGVLLVLLSTVQGFGLQLFANPRVGLSAHVDGLMSGTLLIALSAAWQQIHLGPRATGRSIFLLVWGLYAIWAALVLAAVFGTGASTPLASQGLRAPQWQETFVSVLLISGCVAILPPLVMVLLGLRGRQQHRDGDKVE